MKKTILPLTSIFLLLLFVSSKCKKDIPEPQLPPETATGAMTFGCKVNGKIFIPKDGNGTPGLYAQYANLGSGPNGGRFLNIAASDLKSKLLESVSITSDSLFVLDNKTYDLKKRKGFANGEYWNFKNNSLNEFEILENNSGELQIIKHDLDRRILSGRFWFDATNEAGEKVEVREGRFDIVY